MREKLQKLMASEQLTSSRFAELLGIQPSGVTHLLGGRNKPSFDLVQKILRRFPHINPDWLLLDSEQMYRTQEEESKIAVSATNTETSITPVDAEKFSAAQNTQFSESSNLGSNIEQLATTAGASRKNVKRVIVLFDDHTFESFEMMK